MTRHSGNRKSLLAKIMAMSSPTSPLAVIILAAGKGTRMKSDLHKVLHPIAGRAMLDHLLGVVDRLDPAHKIVVVGSGREQVERVVSARGGDTVVQEPQLGTGHAVAQAGAVLNGFEGDVLILYGDTPLVEAETMSHMLERLNAALAAAARDEGFRRAQQQAGIQVVLDARSSQAGHRSFLAAELARWSPVIKAAGAYAD